MFFSTAWPTTTDRKRSHLIRKARDWVMKILSLPNHTPALPFTLRNFKIPISATQMNLECTLQAPWIRKFNWERRARLRLHAFLAVVPFSCGTLCHFWDYFFSSCVVCRNKIVSSSIKSILDQRPSSLFLKLQFVRQESFKLTLGHLRLIPKNWLKKFLVT